MIKYLIFAFLFSSCANFIKRMDKEEFNFKILPRVEKTFCEKPEVTTSVFSQNPDSSEEFEIFLKRHRELGPVESFVLWSLVQMAYHPDTNSPTAELKIILMSPEDSTIKKSKSVDFWHFKPQVNLYPYISGLISILKYYNSKHTLSSLASLLDQELSAYATVDDQLESFLKTYKPQLAANEVFKSVFLKADEVLRHKEKFKRISFRTVVKLAEDQSHTDEVPISPSHIHMENFKDATILCDFKMDQYEESVYAVQPESVPAATFALTHKNTSIMAVSSMKPKFDSLAETYLMGGESADTTAICYFENKTKTHTLSFITRDSRDPGQHLFHLFKLNLEKVETPLDLDTLLKFSRHLFLTDPLRLIYESHRGSDKQLTELLKLNIPIYNANQLGNINGVIMNHEKGKTSHHIVIDDRVEGHLSCQ